MIRVGLSVRAFTSSCTFALIVAKPLFFQSSIVRKAQSQSNSVADSGYDFTGKSRLQGSYHWGLERVAAVSTAPLLLGAFVVGPHPLIDFGLGFAIPVHVHMGLECIIQDYLPARKNPVLFPVLIWLLRGTTALVMYGCYQFNTNDVGLTALLKRLWTGSL